jgi:hypothetical protein
MSDATDADPMVVHYSPVDNPNHNSTTATAAGNKSFFQTLATKKGIAVMAVVGISLSALLTTLLLVFLLPRTGVQAQSGSNGGSNDPTAGSKYTSPPYYPARIVVL